MEVRHINRSSSATRHPKVYTGAKSELESGLAQPQAPSAYIHVHPFRSAASTWVQLLVRVLPNAPRSSRDARRKSNVHPLYILCTSIPLALGAVLNSTLCRRRDAKTRLVGVHVSLL